MSYKLFFKMQHRRRAVPKVKPESQLHLLPILVVSTFMIIHAEKGLRKLKQNL